jgi:hypothetical protein
MTDFIWSFAANLARTNVLRTTDQKEIYEHFYQVFENVPGRTQVAILPLSEVIPSKRKRRDDLLLDSGGALELMNIGLLGLSQPFIPSFWNPCFKRPTTQWRLPVPSPTVEPLDDDIDGSKPQKRKRRGGRPPGKLSGQFRCERDPNCKLGPWMNKYERVRHHRTHHGAGSEKSQDNNEDDISQDDDNDEIEAESKPRKRAKPSKEKNLVCELDPACTAGPWSSVQDRWDHYNSEHEKELEALEAIRHPSKKRAIV